MVCWSIEVKPHGWARLKIRTGGKIMDAHCSYFYDTLGQLIEAFAQMSDRDGRFELCCHYCPVKNVW